MSLAPGSNSGTSARSGVGFELKFLKEIYSLPFYCATYFFFYGGTVLRETPKAATADNRVFDSRKTTKSRW
jgi:hypothetical protein